MKKKIITSLVAGLMVTSLSAELTENDSIHCINNMKKNNLVAVNAANPHTLVKNISTELTENDTIDPTTEIVKVGYANTTNAHILVNKYSELSLSAIE